MIFNISQLDPSNRIYVLIDKPGITHIKSAAISDHISQGYWFNISFDKIKYRVFHANSPEDRRLFNKPFVRWQPGAASDTTWHNDNHAIDGNEYSALCRNDTIVKTIKSVEGNSTSIPWKIILILAAIGLVIFFYLQTHPELLAQGGG